MAKAPARRRQTPHLVQLAAALRHAREAKGLTQEAVAQRAKLTREYVNMLESGRYEPSVDVVVRLAKALAVPPKPLLDILIAGKVQRYG